MSDTKVPIAEQFYSIQGEGPHAGTPAVFLRLAGCNLSCGLTESSIAEYDPGQAPENGASWICDTIGVWRDSDYLFEPEAVIADWRERGWLDHLRDGAHLVITGGEPLLEKNQQAILDLIDAFAAVDLDPYIEVETNGTIRPVKELWPLVDHWNVSVKLSNSGMSAGERLDAEAIQHFRTVHTDFADMEDKYAKSAIFKFVVGGEEDYNEVIDFRNRFTIPDSMIMLMPAGQTQAQLRETYPEVAEMCKEQGWRFTPRLQIDTWAQATGV